jgi:hypothetical protein
MSNAVFIKSTPGNVMQIFVFLSGGICRSCIAFRCVWVGKRRRNILHAQVGLGRFP